MNSVTILHRAFIESLREILIGVANVELSTCANFNLSSALSEV